MTFSNLPNERKLKSFCHSILRWFFCLFSTFLQRWEFKTLTLFHSEKVVFQLGQTSGRWVQKWVHSKTFYVNRELWNRDKDNQWAFNEFESTRKKVSPWNPKIMANRKSHIIAERQLHRRTAWKTRLRFVCDGIRWAYYTCFKQLIIYRPTKKPAEIFSSKVNEARKNKNKYSRSETSGRKIFN